MWRYAVQDWTGSKKLKQIIISASVIFYAFMSMDALHA
jgi:hypothetical protein